MLRHVLFDLSLFEDEDARANSQKRVLYLLEALTKCNQLWIRLHPETPLIYESGIEYKVPQQFSKEPGQFNGEQFRDIPRIIENGGGDCDNVACWRAAELRELGIPASPYITWRKRADGGTTYHVIVLLADGSSEDPSLLLGMGGEARRKDKEAEEAKLGERMAELLAGNFEPLFGPAAAGRGAEILGQLPSDFGKGLQYTHAFQSGDDAYEDWSPTRPPAYFTDERYKGGLTQGTPYFNTRMRDPDDDYDDRFDGSPSKKRGLLRKIRSMLRSGR